MMAKYMTATEIRRKWQELRDSEEGKQANLAIHRVVNEWLEQCLANCKKAVIRKEELKDGSSNKGDV